MSEELSKMLEENFSKMTEENPELGKLMITAVNYNFLTATDNLNTLETIMTEELTEEEYENHVQRYTLRFWDSDEQEKKTREMLEKYRPKK